MSGPERPPRGTPRAPDFLGIGVQKAGTTWLHRNLAGHPEIFIPEPKEIQYFSEVHLPQCRKWIPAHRAAYAREALEACLNTTPREQTDFLKLRSITEVGLSLGTDDWYRDLFRPAAPSQLCGEITPEYALLPPPGIAHVRALSPEVKVILLLRDPIERNWSHIRMIRARNPQLAVPLETVAGWGEVMNRARYGDIFRRWVRQVGRPNVLVGRTDEINQTPQKFLARLCGFLGVSYAAKHFPAAAKPVFVGEIQEEIPPELYATMRTQLAPVYEDLVKLFPWAQAWRDRHY